MTASTYPLIALAAILLLGAALYYRSARQRAALILARARNSRASGSQS